MASSAEERRRLRPYYIPPSIGDTNPTVSNASINHGGPKAGVARNQPFSSARTMLSDLDYGDYISDNSPSAVETVKSLLDQAIWKYTSVLLAHPFEVAKAILQVYDMGALERPSGKRRKKFITDPRYDDAGLEDSDPDEPSYFTSNATHSDRYRPPISRHTSSQQLLDDEDDEEYSPASPHTLSLSSPSLLAVISQLWTRSGVWGVWAGANTSFIHSVMVKTLESWTRSLLSAIFNLPDPGLAAAGAASVGLDVVDTAYPWATVSITVAAAGIAAVILAPLDTIRTRLMVTPPTHPPRSLLQSIMSLPSLSCPPALLAPTLTFATIPTLASSSTPLLLRSKLGISPLTAPSVYSALTFFSHSLELLFLRLPLETSLRRAQLRHGFGAKGPGETVVPVGEYRGTLGTLWYIAREEGTSGGEVAVGGLVVGRKGGKRKGQGSQGLIRGWRVGMWGLVGVWGASVLGNGGVKGGEF